MSASQLLGAVAGVIVGVVTENPQAGLWTYAAVSGVAAYLSQPDTHGPTLDDLKVQMSSYGSPIPFEWGTNRHSGTVIWPRELINVPHEHSESTKGGPDIITTTYTLSFAVLVGEGEIAGYRRIWRNKKLVYDASAGNTGATQDPIVGTLRFYLGTETQEVDPLIEATDGPSPAYLGYHFVMFEDSDVTDMAGRLPQWEFEVITKGDNDIPVSSVYVEGYATGGLLQGAVDEDGHMWVSTMTGHATYDAITGKYVIDPTGVATRPQIQEYDVATGELLWYYNVPQTIEDGAAVYPIGGSGVYSGGYYFVGRGVPGPSTDFSSDPYILGLAINTRTHSVAPLTSMCAQEQFQNAFYWPRVPVPVLDNNKVYFAGGSGLSGGFALAFQPASIIVPDQADYDPVPDRTGAEITWTTVGDQWVQARPKGACPTYHVFDGVSITFPGWAYKSTVIHNPEAVIVQGPGDDGTYVAWVSYAPAVTGFDLTAASMSYATLPGSQVTMPPIAWDAARGVLWAFAGDDNGTLYSVTPAGEITEIFTFPTFPNGNYVRGMTLDEANGNLRVLIGGSNVTWGAPASLLLFDPDGATILDTTLVLGDGGAVLPFANTDGTLWDVPDQKKTMYTDGYAIYSIPYGAALEPSPVALSTIVSDICVRPGLSTADLNVVQLTPLVDGYIVPHQMTGRAAIEPLQPIFWFDMVESDDKLKFVMRGGDIAATIPEADRAAHEYGQAMPDALSIVRGFDLELPCECDVEYPDIGADHLIGNQYERRITKDTKQKINIQTAVVMTGVKAKQVAVVNCYQPWLKNRYSWTTTRKYAHLEPTDVVALPTAAAVYVARIVSKKENPNGVIEWSGVEEDQSLYTQTGAGAAVTGYVPQTIFSPEATTLVLLDIPLLRDDDDNAGFYVAMGGSMTPTPAPSPTPTPTPAPSPSPSPTPTLYVATTGSDSNSGTSGSPFRTIAHADSVAVPGDVVSVAPGTYTGGFQTTTNGTSGARIRYISATPWGAKIVPPASSSSATGWDSRGDYVTIEGFEVDGTTDPTSGTKWTVGIYIAGTGSIAQYNHVHHIFRTGSGSSAGGAGVMPDSYYGGSDLHAIGNFVHHIGPTTSGNFYHGIYHTGTGSIKDNIVCANTGGGVHMWHDVNHVDVENNTSFANGDGFLFGGGNYVNTSGPADYCTFKNNIAFANTGKGFDQEGDYGTHNVWDYNLSYANGANWSLGTGSHTNTVTANPIFVNYQSNGSGDYHLQATSPAVNAGSDGHNIGAL